MSQPLATKRILFRIVIGVGLMLPVAPSAWGQRYTRRETLRRQAAERIEAALDKLEQDQQYDEAEQTLADLFDQVVGYAGGRDAELFREVGLALRLVRQLGEAAVDEQSVLLTFLRANPRLAANLAFLVQQNDEDAAQIYSLLDNLRKGRENRLERNPTLTAAICVVHDRTAGRSAGPGGSPPAGPLEIFDYYTRNERQFPLRPLAQVPAELLVYVVDVNASIDELAWAAERLGGIPLDGLFQRLLLMAHPPTVVPGPLPSPVTGPPESPGTGPQRLENILLDGGSDEDLAYLVSLTGKAMGIPNVLVTVDLDTLNTAWVGFLDTRGGRAWWNVQTARLVIPPMLHEVSGEVTNPQTNRTISVQTLSLLAGLSNLDPAAKQAAIAMVDGARRLIELETLGESFDPPPLDEGRTGRRSSSPRQPNTQGQLELLESAVVVSNGLYDPAWRTVAELARAGKLDWAQTRRWVELVNRICGQEYSDFTLELVRTMIATVPDVQGQNELWEITFQSFRAIRPDLAAAVRISQGEMWEQAGEFTLALQCYRDVVRLYANSGPFIAKALDKAERLLIRTGHMDVVADLYGEAWDQMIWPPKDEHLVKENTAWFQLGMMYADRLDRAGRPGEARRIRLRLTVY